MECAAAESRVGWAKPNSLRSNTGFALADSLCDSSATPPPQGDFEVTYSNRIGQVECSSCALTLLITQPLETTALWRGREEIWGLDDDKAWRALIDNNTIESE